MPKRTAQQAELDSPDSKRSGNTKDRFRRWCFTLNNWTQEELLHLTNFFDDRNAKYIMGEEVGEEGTPHLQGYVEWPNQVRFETLKLASERAHWEKAKAKRAENVKYCSKDAVHIHCKGFYVKKLVKVLKQEELYPWQLFVENIVQSPPDERTIYWFWEPDGGRGKTALIKYLLVKYEHAAFSRACKASDILTVANVEKTVYLFDFARSQQDFCPWSALEQLKDGLVSDSKLKKETRNLIMNPPIVICFANWRPDMHNVLGRLNLSTDRLIIYDIREMLVNE